MLKHLERFRKFYTIPFDIIRTAGWRLLWSIGYVWRFIQSAFAPAQNTQNAFLEELNVCGATIPSDVMRQMIHEKWMPHL